MPYGSPERGMTEALYVSISLFNSHNAFHLTTNTNEKGLGAFSDPVHSILKRHSNGKSNIKMSAASIHSSNYDHPLSSKVFFPQL